MNLLGKALLEEILEESEALKQDIPPNLLAQYRILGHCLAPETSD